MKRIHAILTTLINIVKKRSGSSQTTKLHNFFVVAFGMARSNQTCDLDLLLLLESTIIGIVTRS